MSKPGPGRPPIPAEVRALIRRFANENGWRARKVHAELEKLGIFVGIATVAWFVIGHGRREILHFGVTEHPTSSWVIQQLRDAFPDDTAPRFLIFDNDSIFADRVTDSIENLGVKPLRTAYRSPWQNGIAERRVGSVRQELLDHAIVLNEDHLRRLLREYVDYYNADRVHTGLRDTPAGRPTVCRPSLKAEIVGTPKVGGLHHRYEWGDAA